MEEKALVLQDGASDDHSVILSLNNKLNFTTDSVDNFTFKK